MFGNHVDHTLVVTQEAYLETAPVNEINGIFDLGIRECEVVANDAIVNAISGRVQESHN